MWFVVGVPLIIKGSCCAARRAKYIAYSFSSLVDACAYYPMPLHLCWKTGLGSQRLYLIIVCRELYECIVVGHV